MEVRCYREKFQKFPAWAAFFRFFRYRLTVLRTADRKHFYPKSMSSVESRDTEVCLFLIWRVCDQTFSRYRSLNGAEKWPHDHHENSKFAYGHTQKNSLITILKAIRFDLRRSYRGITVSEQWRHQALVAFAARHSPRTNHCC